MQQGEAKWENWLTREQAYWNLNLLQMMLNMECCLQFFKIHIVRPLFYARNFPFWLSNYLDQTSIYLWTLTRFPNVCRSADQLSDFSVRGLEKRRSYRNRWTPILLDGKQQQMLWQCLLSPFFAVYLKLNYVEKVMKREIGNGFSDKATSSTWLAKSKKLKMNLRVWFLYWWDINNT